MAKGSIRETALALARAEKWDEFDAKVTDAAITNSDLEWARSQGPRLSNANERDAAASFLSVSSKKISPSHQNDLRGWMRSDPSPIVQQRIAIALYKRGNPNADVEQMFEEALNSEEATIRNLAKTFHRPKA